MWKRKEHREGKGTNEERSGRKETAFQFHKALILVLSNLV